MFEITVKEGKVNPAHIICCCVISGENPECIKCGRNTVTDKVYRYRNGNPVDPANHPWMTPISQEAGHEQ